MLKKSPNKIIKSIRNIYEVCFKNRVLFCKVIIGYKWRRQWQPIPVLLPGKSHGQRSLAGCSPWGSLRVGHDWVTSLSVFTFMHWRRKWQPSPVFLPGESQGRGSLVGCHLWGCAELDTTEATQQQQQQHCNISGCFLPLKICSHIIFLR